MQKLDTTTDTNNTIADTANTIIETVIDTPVDTFDKFFTSTNRAGAVVERVGKMLDAKVSPKVIALQLTENSPNSTTYTETHVTAYGDLYKDSKTKVVITKKQARSLTKDQQSK